MTGLFQRALNLDIILIHTMFLFHITGETLLVTHRGLFFNSLEFVKF